MDVHSVLTTYQPRHYLTRDGWIYAVRLRSPSGDSAVKVGFSANPEKRLLNLVGGVPWKVTPVAMVAECTREMEGRLHKRLRAIPGAHLSCEWYDGCVADILAALLDGPLEARAPRAVRPLKHAIQSNVLSALREVAPCALPVLVSALRAREPEHRYTPTGVLAVLRALKRKGAATADRMGVWSTAQTGDSA